MLAPSGPVIIFLELTEIYASRAGQCRQAGQGKTMKCSERHVRVDV